MTNQKDIVCGVHPVIEILRRRNRTIITLFVQEGKLNPNIAQVVKLAKRQNIKINRKERKDLDRLSGKNVHQGVVAFAEPLSALTLKDAIALNKTKKSVWLAVDEITDPQNLGTIIRSAVCFGVKFIILPAHRTAGISPSVYKSACGAMENINIVSVSNLNWAILNLKENGYWIYGADLKGKPMDSISYNAPAVLIIGSEDKGLRYKTRRHCDELITISQTSKIRSLNASCAASIVLYDMYCKILK